MINQLVLTGRLTKDVDLRTTESGRTIANFSLAVNRNFKNANGEYDTDFVNCIIWGEGAKHLAKYCVKGDLIGIVGRLQTRTYEKENRKIYVTEVVVENVTFLSVSPKGEKREEEQVDPFEEMGQFVEEDENLPF